MTVIHQLAGLEGVGQAEGEKEAKGWWQRPPGLPGRGLGQEERAHHSCY